MNSSLVAAKYHLSRLTSNQPYELARRLLMSADGMGGLVERVRDRRLLFVASSGRTGTQFLAELLDSAPRTRAEHEPRPRLNGKYLQTALREPLTQSYESRRLKVLGLAVRLRRLPPEWTYAETSHLFVKTFYDVILDAFPRAEVIILRRDPVKVIKSCLDLGYFGPRNPFWRMDMHVPAPGRCVASPIAPPQEMDECDRCIAYLVDVEARVQRMRQQYPRTPYYEVFLEDIAQADGAQEFLRRLDIPCSAATSRVAGERHNTRVRRKKGLGMETDAGYCRRRLEQYLSKAQERGLSIPDLPAP